MSRKLEPQERKNIICILAILAILAVVLVATFWTFGGFSASVPAASAAPASTEPVAVPFPRGEYVTQKLTVAGLTTDSLTLTIKAFTRNDIASMHTLRDEGLTFQVPKKTIVALWPEELPGGAQLSTTIITTIDGFQLCNGTIESGDRIGTNVAIVCDNDTLKQQ